MKFSMSEAWREATAMIAANREVLLIVAGIFFFLPSLAVNWALGDLPEMMMADPEKMQDAILALYLSLWWLIVLAWVVSMVGSLTLLALLRDHNRPTVGQAIVAGLVGFLPWLVAYVLLGVALLVVLGAIGFLMGLVGNVAIAFVGVLIMLAVMFYVMVKVSLSGPVIAIDKVYNPITILTRSWQLTKGNSLRLFLFYLLIWIVYVVVSGVVTGIINVILALAAGSDTALLVTAIVSALITGLFSLVLVAVQAAAHRQLAGPSAGALNATFE